MEKAKPQANFDWGELEALRHAMRHFVMRPRGFNSLDYAAKFGLSRSRAQEEIRRLLVAERIVFVGFGPTGIEDSRGRLTGRVKFFDYVKVDDVGPGR